MGPQLGPESWRAAVEVDSEGQRKSCCLVPEATAQDTKLGHRSQSLNGLTFPAGSRRDIGARAMQTFQEGLPAVRGDTGCLKVLGSHRNPNNLAGTSRDKR